MHQKESPDQRIDSSVESVGLEPLIAANDTGSKSFA